MMERPNPDDEPVLPDDPAPAPDPQVPAKKLIVTPLDEDEHIKDGIEIKET